MAVGSAATDSQAADHDRQVTVPVAPCWQGPELSKCERQVILSARVNSRGVGALGDALDWGCCWICFGLTSGTGAGTMPSPSSKFSTDLRRGSWSEPRFGLDGSSELVFKFGSLFMAGTGFLRIEPDDGWGPLGLVVEERTSKGEVKSNMDFARGGLGWRGSGAEACCSDGDSRPRSRSGVRFGGVGTEGSGCAMRCSC